MGCAASSAPHWRQRRSSIGCSAYRLADFGASGQRFELSQVAQWALGSTDIKTCESGVVRPGHVVDTAVVGCMNVLPAVPISVTEAVAVAVVGSVY